ncbi:MULTISPECIES: hypothetical protein [Vagococcus]|uniref:hypothetical protein n=1 Tax=Vagococcus TaxID=2737 RepID=UPI001652AE47|nr:MULTISPECIES: hypothetical protein [Vagococcus]
MTNSVKPTPKPSPKPNIVSETEGFTITSGKGAKTSTANSAKKDFATEPFLPEEFYKNNRLPKNVEPGTKSLDKFDDLGNLKQTKYYDQYGREKGWVDYTDHGRPDAHSAPHWHEYTYNEKYPLGKKTDHKFDTNPPYKK